MTQIVRVDIPGDVAQGDSRDVSYSTAEAGTGSFFLLDEIDGTTNNEVQIGYRFFNPSSRWELRPVFLRFDTSGISASSVTLTLSPGIPPDIDFELTLEVHAWPWSPADDGDWATPGELGDPLTSLVVPVGDTGNSDYVIPSTPEFVAALNPSGYSEFLVSWKDFRLSTPFTPSGTTGSFVRISAEAGDFGPKPFLTIEETAAVPANQALTIAPEALPHRITERDGKKYPRSLKKKLQDNFDAIERQLLAIGIEEE